MTKGDSLAIIGLAARVPDAADAEEFWANLVAGRESIHRLTEEQLRAAGEDPCRLADPHYVRARPLLDEVDGFDERYFGLSRHESELRNPQHRLFLELCASALQHAGYDPGGYDGLIGVYGGAAYDRYVEDHIRADPRLVEQAGEMVINVANNIDYLATYVSYRLGLRGPSLSVRTACSTSLVATHLACQALRNGECDIALAGGVEIEMPYGRGYLHAPGGIDSQDGSCRPLDADASGTVFGSGGGIVALKRLSDAIADGDTVVAVITGSAVSNDGADRPGFTAPSAEGQSQAIAEAMMVAGADPASISYVELHGTGTVLGDPVEVHGLAHAFRLVAQRDLPPGQCGIGSVKSNIGHLGPASGVVGLIKTALALQRRQLPPTLNVRTPNPRLELDSSPFYIVDRLRPWDGFGATSRRAGVSSFGFGGTNVHVVLEEAPVQESPSGPALPDQPELLVWSVMDDTVEAALRARLARALVDNASTARDVAYTSQVGRRALPVRAALRFTAPAQAAEALADPHGVLTARGDGTHRPCVFLLPGQGAQRVQAGTGLATHLPGFSTRLREDLAGFGDLLGIDLVKVWEAETDPQVVAQTVYAQPLLFSIEHALARTLTELGVEATLLAGHSVGELVAATLAGVFTPAEAIKVVARRAQLMQDLPPGRMMAISADQRQVRELLPAGVAISAVNGARQVVVGGAATDLERFRERLRERGVQTRDLPTSHAFHTPMMEPAVPELTAVIAGCQLREPALPMVSAATGAVLTPDQARSPAFWAEQIVRPVNFHAALEALASPEPRLLLEVGPGRTLTGLARRLAGGHRAVAALPREAPADEWPDLLDAIATAWVDGSTIDWLQLPRTGPVRRVPLPHYPYQRRPYWLPEVARRARDGLLEQPAAVPGRAAPVGQSASEAPVLALPGWRPAEPVLPGATPSAVRRGDALVLLPADRAVAQYAQVAVQLAGYRVIPVWTDAGADLQPHSCVVRPGHPGDLADVLAFLAEVGVAPSLLVHARALGPAAAGVAADDPGLLQDAFWSVFHLLQTAARWRREQGQAIPMVMLARHAVSVTGAEPLVPARAMSAGLIRSAVLEYGADTARMIDVAGVTEAVLAAELTWQAGADSVVALRPARRWLPEFTTLDLAAAGPSLLTRGGTYLITGGLGGIGLAVARGLADTGLRPRLILLTRRSAAQAEEECADELAVLRAAGAEIQLLTGDLAGAASARRALADLPDRVDGILHAAGLPGDGFLDGRPSEAARAVLDPKVTGSVLLGEFARGRPDVRFLVFFSSRAALNGLVGSADYAAANAFQDALALASTGADRAVVSINWPTWLDTGMATLAGGVGPAGTRWQLRIAPADWLLSEHVVAGRRVVPGAAYLDFLARAVRAQPGGDSLAPIVVEELTLPEPLVVRRPIDVTVRLTPVEGGWEAAVESAGGARHATARVSVAAELEPPKDPGVAAGERAAVRVPSLSEKGFVLGPRFDCVQEARQLADGVIVGALELSGAYESDLDEHVVHPALLDRALALQSSHDGHLPFSCQRAVIYDDLPAQVTARVRVRRADSSLTTVDAELYDSLGRAVVVVEGFTKLPQRAAAGRAPAAPARGAGSGVTGITEDAGVRTLLGLLVDGLPPTVAVLPPGSGRPEPTVAPNAVVTPDSPSATAGHPGGPPVPRAAGEPGSPAAAAPDTDSAEVVASLLADALGLAGVGPDDDFFNLGGDSLTAVQLLSRLRDRLGVTLSVGDLFDHPTPRQLAATIEGKRD